MSWNDIPGWANFRDLYDDYVKRAEHGDIVVEVGVAFGKSLAYLSDAVRASGKRVTIYGIDPWLPNDGDDNICPQSTAPIAEELGGPFCAAMAMMFKHARQALEHVRILRIPSPHAARLFAPASLAMVLIDGDHSYEGVKSDILGWSPMVRPGGILAGDHYNFPGVRKAVDEVLGEVEVRGATWIVKAAAKQEAPSSTNETVDQAAVELPPAEEWLFVETVGGTELLGRLIGDVQPDSLALEKVVELPKFKSFYPIFVPGEEQPKTGEMELQTAWKPRGLPGDHKKTVRWASYERISDMDPAARAMMMQRVRSL